MSFSVRSLATWLTLCGFAMTLAGFTTFGVLADDPKPNKSGKPAKSPDKKSADRGSADRGDVPVKEAAALEFARRHHPELAALLEQLKTNVPKEYQAAIADLDRSRQRLEKSREKTPEQYDLELAEWKVNSRIRLLVARLTMGADETLKDELFAAVKERHDIRTQLLAAEQQRLQQRLEKVHDQLAEQRSRSDELIERELAGLLSSTSTTPPKPGRSATASKTTAPKESVVAKPAPTKNPTKSPKPGGDEKSPSKSEDKPKSKPPIKPPIKPTDAPKSNDKP